MLQNEGIRKLGIDGDSDEEMHKGGGGGPGGEDGEIEDLYEVDDEHLREEGEDDAKVEALFQKLTGQ